MSSSALVIISSSPPRTFAQSPTPATSPLPPQFSATPLREGAKRFKSSAQIRGDFSDDFSGFTAARALSAKLGAENVPLRSSSQARFKSQSPQSSQNDRSDIVKRSKFMKNKPASQAEQLSGYFKHSKTRAPSHSPEPKTAKVADPYDTEEYHEAALSPRLDLASGQRNPSPALVEKAVPRRLDWTPVKSNGFALESPESGSRDGGFSDNLLDAYTYAESSRSEAGKITTKIPAEVSHLKRKRLDIVMATEVKAHSNLCKTIITQGPENTAKTKKKAPAKKALTITSLATSAYSDGRSREAKLPPMLEHLAASQASTAPVSDSGLQTSIKKASKTKTIAKKARPRGKGATKSRLVSPKSAMKTTLEQEVVFGPASQLARDESPTLTRNTVEAMKLSEALWSDQTSPQRTQAFSVDFASPKVMHGTGRFDKKRNLWAAAGRDGDNALLQVETVDLTDSPAVREAFAGKDALFQPDGPTYRHRGSASGFFNHPSSTRTPCSKNVGIMLDIDDIVTPGPLRTTVNPAHSQIRGMHTSRPLTRLVEENKTDDQPANADSVATNPSPKPVPIMPPFAGWSDHELKKQISTYGFKAIKKREKMIELLERCWKSEHGIEHDEPTSAMTHGDFVSKVHDVSTRPVPKVKKPRAKKNPASEEPSTVKKPKRKATSATKVTDSSTPKKAARKRTKKAPSSEKVVDVDEIGNSGNQPTVAAGRDMTASSMKQDSNAEAEPISTRLATPPATIPQLDFTSSSPVVEEPHQSDRSKAQDCVLTPEQTPAPDIQAQIYAAICCSPKVVGKTKSSRNHQESPTWYEKILMYDPIVLEDLTGWLNTEGFKTIGEDREVSLLEVRTWCEQNGVCCYAMGGGWRGRGKHGPG